METILPIFQALCVLIAAAILGNWYMAESRRIKAAGKPWYAIYKTPPGLLILAVLVLLPIAVSFL